MRRLNAQMVVSIGALAVLAGIVMTVVLTRDNAQPAQPQTTPPVAIGPRAPGGSIFQNPSSPSLSKPSPLGQTISGGDGPKFDTSTFDIFNEIPGAIAGIASSVLDSVNQIAQSQLDLENPPVKPASIIPLVPDSQLTIRSNGIADMSAYLEYFAMNMGSSSVDMALVAQARKSDNGAPLPPLAAIDAAIADKNFSSISGSIALYRDLITKKIAFFKTIPVTGLGIAINKKMIGVDILTLELLDRADQVRTGATLQASFERWYADYLSALETERLALTEATQGPVSSAAPDWFVNATQPKTAEAAGFPFGGMIATITYCTCDGGLAVSVGPPRGGYFYASLPFLASPLLFLYRMLHPGAWVLGTYVPAPGCWMYIGYGCVPTNFQMMTMAGTSK